MRTVTLLASALALSIIAPATVGQAHSRVVASTPAQGATVAQPRAVTQGGPRIGGPWPHVTGIGAGKNLSHKGGSGGGGQGHGAIRIPQNINAKGHGDV